MAYADDIDIVFRALHKAKEIFLAILTEVQEMGLVVNEEETNNNGFNA